MNRRTRRGIRFGIAALVAISFARTAQADSVSINLTQSSQTAAPGTAVTFEATISNPSSTDTVYLNGDSSVTSSPLLSLDDTPFLTNFPLWLDPGETSGPFALFNILIDPSTPDGTYDLNSFAILGGLDGSTFDTVGATDFSINVANVTPTPEIETLYLFSLGLLFLFGVALREGSSRNLDGTRKKAPRTHPF